MATKTKDEGDLFVDAICDVYLANTSEAWKDFWDKWFVCRYSELRAQFVIDGGFGDNEDESPCVYAHHDEMMTCEWAGGGNVTPTASLEDVIASYFQIKEPDEAEAAIRDAVERGIKKGREQYADDE